MKSTLLALALGLSVSTASFAQSGADTAISSVINSQLQAFQADDFAQAFTFASPMIQSLFGNPDRFGQMVQQGYPMVWRPDTVRYGAARMQGDTVFQKVIITDQSGTLHVLEYEMIPVSGDWQINGVQLLRPPQVGA